MLPLTTVDITYYCICLGCCAHTIYTDYNDAIMGAVASQITSLTIIYSIVYSDADQRKHQSSASLAFVRGIHRGPVNSPHKWPVTRKMFPFDDVIMDWRTAASTWNYNSPNLNDTEDTIVALFLKCHFTLGEIQLLYLSTFYKYMISCQTLLKNVSIISLFSDIFWRRSASTRNHNIPNPIRHIPANMLRDEYVIITSKRRFDVIITYWLRSLFAGHLTKCHLLGKMQPSHLFIFLMKLYSLDKHSNNFFIRPISSSSDVQKIWFRSSQRR